MRRPFSLAAALFSVLSLFAPQAWAQNVVLNPATIQGTLTLTGQTLSNAYVSASWTDTSTNPPTTYSASTTASGGNYSLIVNVPQGSTPTYTVYAYGYIAGTNQYFNFPSQTVNPDPATAQTLNFMVNPGIIQGTVTATSGTLSSFYIYAGSEYSYFPGSPGTYSIVVTPGTQLNVYGYGYGQFGGGQLSPSNQYIDVTPGQTVTGIDWTIALPATPPQGAIGGTVTLTGSVTPTYININASGPSYSNVAATPTYSMPDLYAGSYYMYGSAQFPNNTYLSFADSAFSPSRSVTVSGGATTIVDITGTENFLNGVITLGGTNTLADVSSASFSASGIYGTDSYGGSGSAQLPANGAFSLVLTDGSWAPSNLYLNFYQVSDPANYLYEQLYFFDNGQYANPVELSGGETVTKNLVYATGKITINFQALGSATFSNPQLYANCSQVDPVTNQTLWSYSAYAYNYSLNNVTEGGVTFVGMAGNCQIQASAYVNGSNYVTFGTLNATVEPGVIKEIDINGPTLVVTSPAAGAVLPAPSVVVTGTADDEVVDIASITVNGIAATMTSTNDPAHPHQVTFSATVPLNPGANTLTTVVIAEDTDEPGKQASDTRTVSYFATPTISATGGTFTYSGSPHAGSGSATGANGSLPVTLTYTGTGSTSYGPTSAAPTNAGTYVVVAHTDGDATTLSGDSDPASLVINKADASISVSGYDVTFDGASHTATGSATGVLGESLSGLDLSATAHTAVGTYTDSWSFTDVTGNYNDAAGTVIDKITSDVVHYNVCGVEMPKGPRQSGSTIPVKLQVCDDNGANVSSSSIVVHATGIELVAGTVNGTLQDSGNANPGMNFRLVGPPAMYMFNLQTKGFKSGTYNLLFTIGSDPTVHAVQFQIR